MHLLQLFSLSILSAASLVRADSFDLDSTLRDVASSVSKAVTLTPTFGFLRTIQKLGNNAQESVGSIMNEAMSIYPVKEAEELVESLKSLVENLWTSQTQKEDWQRIMKHTDASKEEFDDSTLTVELQSLHEGLQKEISLYEPPSSSKCGSNQGKDDNWQAKMQALIRKFLAVLEDAAVKGRKFWHASEEDVRAFFMRVKPQLEAIILKIGAYIWRKSEPVLLIYLPH